MLKWKVLAEETEGKYDVPLDEDHYQNLILVSKIFFCYLL